MKLNIYFLAAISFTHNIQLVGYLKGSILCTKWNFASNVLFASVLLLLYCHGLRINIFLSRCRRFKICWQVFIQTLTILHNVTEKLKLSDPMTFSAQQCFDFATNFYSTLTDRLGWNTCIVHILLPESQTLTGFEKPGGTFVTLKYVKVEFLIRN